MAGPHRKYTRELLVEAVEHSTSVAGVLRYLGLNQAGGTHSLISRTIKRFEIDTSHFVRYQNGAHRQRYTAAQILVRIPRGSRRTPARRLKRGLDELGVPYVCAGCGNDGTWQGVALLLEIDHIDGDYHNNTAENLRYMCPNCHAQTDTWCGRSKGKYSQVVPPLADAASEAEAVS